MKHLVLAAVAVLAMLLSGADVRLAHAESGYGNQKVVYHNNGGAPDNPTYFKKLLLNISNHVEAVGKEHIDVKVVDHGLGLDMFTLANTDKSVADRIDALKAVGVRFLICANTLRERKIDWHTLYGVEETDIVPSGAAELVKLQSLGYAYLHM